MIVEHEVPNIFAIDEEHVLRLIVKLGCRPLIVQQTETGFRYR